MALAALALLGAFIPVFLAAALISHALGLGEVGFLVVLGSLVGLPVVLVGTTRAYQQERRAVDALVNDIRAGRLPVLEDSRPFIPKPGELVHTFIGAQLMGDVTRYKGGGGGVSLGLGPIRVFSGGGSGRRVTSTEAVDGGVLLVTSQRAVYMGGKQTLDIPYSKLVAFHARRGWKKTLLFHLPNKKLRPLALRGSWKDGEVAVAVIEVAIARAQNANGATSAPQAGHVGRGPEPPAVGTRGNYKGRPVEVVRVRERDNALRVRFEDGSERWIAPSSLSRDT